MVGIWALIPLGSSGKQCSTHTSGLFHPRGEEARAVLCEPSWWKDVPVCTSSSALLLCLCLHGRLWFGRKPCVNKMETLAPEL